MSHVVFFRAANVGGRNVFKPARLAAALAHFDVVNVGAAGTLLVRGKVPAARIRGEILEHMPFELQMAVVPAKDVLAVVRSAPFRGMKSSADLRAWAAVFVEKSRSRPKLPYGVPEGKDWTVRLERIEGVFALGVWRRRPGRFLFPNQIVEKVMGVRSTTRWWETIERVARLIEGDPSAGRGVPGRTG